MNIKNQKPCRSVRTLVIDIVDAILECRNVFNDTDLANEVVRELKSFYHYDATVEEVTPFLEEARKEYSRK